MTALLTRLRRWSEQRVAKCRICKATSDRQFGTGAYRIAANHARGTGHVVTVSRVGRIFK
jgi:hypothetical protein